MENPGIVGNFQKTEKDQLSKKMRNSEKPGYFRKMLSDQTFDSTIERFYCKPKSLPVKFFGASLKCTVAQIALFWLIFEQNP